jgi:hypothetical protein
MEVRLAGKDNSAKTNQEASHDLAFSAPRPHLKRDHLEKESRSTSILFFLQARLPGLGRVVWGYAFAKVILGAESFFKSELSPPM